MLFSSSLSASMLRATGGVVVTMGDETTYGHLTKGPIQVLNADGGGVQTFHASVVIANGILSEISASEGIGVELTIEGVDYTVKRIVTPPGEPNGEMLELLLKLAPVSAYLALLEDGTGWLFEDGTAMEWEHAA